MVVAAESDTIQEFPDNRDMDHCLAAEHQLLALHLRHPQNRHMEDTSFDSAEEIDLELVDIVRAVVAADHIDPVRRTNNLLVVLDRDHLDVVTVNYFVTVAVAFVVHCNRDRNSADSQSDRHRNHPLTMMPNRAVEMSLANSMIP